MKIGHIVKIFVHFSDVLIDFDCMCHRCVIKTAFVKLLLHKQIVKSQTCRHLLDLCLLCELKPIVIVDEARFYVIMICRFVDIKSQKRFILPISNQVLMQNCPYIPLYAFLILLYS